jgi:DNA-directed RNA polymerase specialized sigma24 family protein
MADEGPDMGSITDCIDRLRGGDQDAAQTLWERYYTRLVGLARSKLRRPGGVEDEEDAAASALDSLCRSLRSGGCLQVTDRDNLWRLLVEITACKAYDQIERRRRLKRGGAHIFEDAEFDRLVGDGPTGDFACEASEQLDRLMVALRDPVDRQVAWMKMECYTRAEIARSLDCHEKTIANRLKGIRLAWIEAGLVAPNGSPVR